ncbi:MAG: dephospho-CoA kinase [Dinghuibacter sp.]|nr:dephospho-CoA kinase [Dinghuibacter sp.]
MIVGLTGGIGSGKSTIARIFSVLGIPVYNADAAAKKLVNGHPAIREQITGYFGPESYVNGEYNRKFIAGIVFSEPEKLEWLNALVHPYTIADAATWAAAQQSPYVIKEAALMFESASFHHTDAVIGVSAPETLRLHRVMKRDGATRESVLQRMSRQLPESMKMKLCNYIIYNDEQQAVIPQTLHIHHTLLQQAAQKP